MNIDKLVVVKKLTQLEELLKRHSTTSQVKFYLESRGDSYDFYQESHNTYTKNFQEILKEIPLSQRMQIIDREHLPSYLFGNNDLVVVVGDDGLFVNVAKYVGEQPIISVNPDTNRYDGVLSSCSTKEFSKTLKKTLDQDKNLYLEKLTMAKAELNDGQVMYALNDLFMGRKTHVSARYIINHEAIKERQSSSGIIVSTGTGSTGWMTSVMVGAKGISGKSYPTPEVPFARNSNYLLFAVREPFPSIMTGTDLIYGKITENKPLIITSNMPEEGVIFSDGIESDYLNFCSGSIVTIKPAEKQVNLIKKRKV